MAETRNQNHKAYVDTFKQMCGNKLVDWNRYTSIGKLVLKGGEAHVKVVSQSGTGSACRKLPWHALNLYLDVARREESYIVLLGPLWDLNEGQKVIEQTRRYCNEGGFEDIHLINSNQLTELLTSGKYTPHHIAQATLF